jgi:hypothetical protein
MYQPADSRVGIIKGVQITEDEIHSIHGRDEKCIQIFGRNARDFNVDGKTT